MLILKLFLSLHLSWSINELTWCIRHQPDGRRLALNETTRNAVARHLTDAYTLYELTHEVICLRLILLYSPGSLTCMDKFLKHIMYPFVHDLVFYSSKFYSRNHWDDQIVISHSVPLNSWSKCNHSSDQVWDWLAMLKWKLPSTEAHYSLIHSDQISWNVSTFHFSWPVLQNVSECDFIRTSSCTSHCDGFNLKYTSWDKNK